MIKSLFDYDDKELQPKENKSETETEESIRRQLDEMNLSAETSGADDEIETVILPRIERVYAADANEPSQPPLSPGNVFPENQFFEVETETRPLETAPISPEVAPLPPEAEPPPPQVSTAAATPYRNVLQNENAPTNESVSQTENIYKTENAAPAEAQSLTTAETIRQS
ncbi:MAG TPA: hypothetical protein VF599_04230, partial [Pyrinomonadaceae bacterium]